MISVPFGKTKSDILKMRRLNTKKSEGLIYLIIWLAIFLMPVFMSRTSLGFDWRRIGHEWLRISPFFLIFGIHNFLFFPKLFVPGKRSLYFLVTVLTVLAISIGWILFGRYWSVLPDLKPIPLNGQLPVPREMSEQIKPWYVNFIDKLIISVLVVGFNSAIKLTAIWQEEEQKNRLLEKEKLQTELAFLRNQVSPHFFMNTLNNIHALIDVNSEDAKESIVKLSRMMRYLLYDSENGESTLKKEIEFLTNYVELMKLRVVPHVIIEFSFPNKIPDLRMPPLLFISVVENAFKYGISYQNKSFVQIFLNFKENELYFRVKNSLHKKSEETEKGGLGLKNLKKRLELIYGEHFSLQISEKESSFETNIILPLHGN